MRRPPTPRSSTALFSGDSADEVTAPPRLSDVGRHGWFWVDVQLSTPPAACALGPEEMTGVELAMRLGRPRRSVRQAIQRGRIPLVGYAARGDAIVRVTEAELTRWRVQPFLVVLAHARLADPTLPATASDWYSAHALAQLLRVSQATVTRALMAHRVRSLEWDTHTPFRAQRRYCVPDPGRLLLPKQRPKRKRRLRPWFATRLKRRPCQSRYSTNRCPRVWKTTTTGGSWCRGTRAEARDHASSSEFFPPARRALRWSSLLLRHVRLPARDGSSACDAPVHMR